MPRDFSENLHIYCPAEHYHYYLTEVVQQTAIRLQKFLGMDHQIHLYPEATMKTNKMPNGLGIISERKCSILLPQLLRDPGCGFLMFKIKKSSKTQHVSLYHAMDEYLWNKENTIFHLATKKEVKRALKEGVFNLAREDSWDSLIQHNYEPDSKAIKLNDDHYFHLMSDMNIVTNSVELKYVESEPDSIIGMLHTGSEIFPKLILGYWSNILHAYTRKHLHDAPDLIEKGYWGVHSSDERGYEYVQWLKAAMNFCLYKRYHIFTELREHLRGSLGIDLELINDRCHAGLFEKKISGKHYQIQSRGVQPLETERSKLFLIAGHRETVSLVLNLEHKLPDHFSLIGHGTGYVNDPEINYHEYISDDLFEKCTNAYTELHTNTPKRHVDLLPFTVNVLNQYEGILSPSQYEIAFPLYNFMGRPLRGLFP